MRRACAPLEAALLGIAAAALGGCAGVRVEPLGEGVYGVVSRDAVSVMRARDVAVRRAEGFCRELGGLPVTVASANRSTPVLPEAQVAVYDLAFHCVGPGLSPVEAQLTPEQALERLRAASR